MNIRMDGNVGLSAPEITVDFRLVLGENWPPATSKQNKRNKT